MAKNFAILWQPIDTNKKDVWYQESIGYPSAIAAREALQKSLDKVTVFDKRYTIISVEKTIVPKVTLVEEGENEKQVPQEPSVVSLVDVIPSVLPKQIVPPGISPKPYLATGKQDLSVEPPYKEPTGSDPTQLSNVPTTPTSESSGEKGSSIQEEPSSPSASSSSSSKKSPDRVPSDSLFPPRW